MDPVYTGEVDKLSGRNHPLCRTKTLYVTKWKDLGLGSVPVQGKNREINTPHVLTSNTLARGFRFEKSDSCK